MLHRSTIQFWRPLQSWICSCMPVCVQWCVQTFMARRTRTSSRPLPVLGTLPCQRTDGVGRTCTHGGAPTLTHPKRYHLICIPTTCRAAFPQGPPTTLLHRVAWAGVPPTQRLLFSFNYICHPSTARSTSCLLRIT